MKKAIFLDRDGTLIVDKYYLNNAEEVEYLPGIFDCMVRLKEAGYIFVIVTNQSGVPRGWVSEDNLKEIHDRLERDFSVYGIQFSAIYFAPHLPNSNHIDRKPREGMLLRGAKELNIDLSQSWMVGDKMSDVEAGHRAGVHTILIGDLDDPKKSPYSGPEFQIKEAAQIADIICNNESP